MPRTPTAPVARKRATVAALSRHRATDDPALLDARRDLRATVAEDYIKQLVDGAPPLTDDQRARLAAILQGAA